MCCSGRSNLCRTIGYVGEVIDGGFAPFVSLKAGQVLKLHDQSMAPEIAAMTEPLAVALHAVARLAPSRQAPVLVTGAGPIGALTAIVLSHRGFGPLLLADRNEARLRLVAEITGAETIEIAAVAERTGNTLRYAVETTGAAAVLSDILRQIGPGGRIASVGIFHGHAALELNRIVEGEVDLLGCAAFRDEFAEANELLAVLAPSLKAIASPPIPLEEVPAAYEALIAGRVATIKTIIRPN
jgi:(R,R)-butanediol dehydrogenase/meso-butanediol dehydrogenase/diacetyl reductase